MTAHVYTVLIYTEKDSPSFLKKSKDIIYSGTPIKNMLIFILVYYLCYVESGQPNLH